MINLTQHTATSEQSASGVIDFSIETKKILNRLLTFNELSDTVESELKYRADSIVLLIKDFYPEVDKAMIGGALYFMPVLVKTLFDAGIVSYYSFSKRVSYETIGLDGIVSKTSTFKHIGFVKG